MTRHLVNGTCPECRGPLTQIQDNDIVEYECLVGHRFTPQALLHKHVEAEERTLWAAVVALEEAQNLVEAVASHLPERVRRSLSSEAERKAEQGAQVRQIVYELAQFRND